MYILQHNDTFKFEVEAFGKRKIPRCDKIAKMELFDFLPFTGDIDLQQPIWTYHIIEYYGQENNCVPNQPFKVFFGRQVCYVTPLFPILCALLWGS